MMTRLLHRQRRRVEALSLGIEHKRLVTRELRREGHAALGNKLSGGWALAGCFAAGVVSARWGGSLGRRLKTLPLTGLARQLWAHLLI
ncbi:hypothetical protein [Marinimicrobium agarilyticum]|uniref:hypothetical protein n=1 Tax=Marinimicrobium agarilyticum TaxID=306546 RepID=UPI0012F6BD0F|nr:hypothetical protein [Marinimicrobium agarilyticum]